MTAARKSLALARAASARTAVDHETHEDGNILVLAMGYVLVIVLVVLLTATLSGLHLERKRLLALADSAALVATDYVSGQNYLATLGTPDPRGGTASLDQTVSNFMDRAPAAQGFTGLQIAEVSQSATGQVTVTLTSQRSFLASFNLEGPSAFTAHLEATGTATSLESGN